MRRAVAWAMAAVCLTGCPGSSGAHSGGSGDAGSDIEVQPLSSDVIDAGDVMDADAVDVVDSDRVADVFDADAPDGDVGIRMEFEFTSVALHGSAGGIGMRANMVWYGSLRGEAGGILFEGSIR